MPLYRNRIIILKSKVEKLGVNIKIVQVFRNCLLQDRSGFFQPI